MSSLQVDNGQVLEKTQRVNTDTGLPGDISQGGNGEAEMRAWQFRDICHLPLHLGYPGHPDLSLSQRCSPVRTRSIAEVEQNTERLCVSFGMQAIGIRKRWQAVNSDVYSRRPLALRWAVAPWLSRAAVSRLGKRRESQSIYRLERWHASLPPCRPRVAHLTAVWVPLALAALGQVFRDCQ